MLRPAEDTEFGVMLQAAHAGCKNDRLRFFIQERHPVLVGEDDEPILDGDGEIQYDWDAEPYQAGVVQVWRYDDVDEPTRVLAGQVEIPMQVVDQPEPRIVRMVIEETHHELVKLSQALHATSQTPIK